MFLTCSSPTENNKVTFSPTTDFPKTDSGQAGQVSTINLADTSDYSGVTVSLYKPVELDTALVRINEEYPNIGVQILQETEFDHRERFDDAQHRHTPLNLS